MRPYLGAHVSAAGGYYRAVERAGELGAEVIQIFGASPRQWKVGAPAKEEIQKYKEALGKSGIKSVYLHAAYLVNLAGSEELFGKSVDNLAAHLEIACALGAEGLIFHIGSSRDPFEKASERVVRGMREVLGKAEGSAKLVMENASGGGGKIGSTLEELAYLQKEVRSDRVALCLDTAHAFEAGVLDFTPSGIENFFDRWDRSIGLRSLVAIHANDSKTKFGSMSDRHENIGEGEIGLRGFENLSRRKGLEHVPWILEVPGFDGQGPDKRNLDILKSIFK